MDKEITIDLDNCPDLTEERKEELYKKLIELLDTGKGHPYPFLLIVETQNCIQTVSDVSKESQLPLVQPINHEAMERVFAQLGIPNPLHPDKKDQH